MLFAQKITFKKNITIILSITLIFEFIPYCLQYDQYAKVVW